MDSPGYTTFEQLYTAYAERILNLVFRMTSEEEASRDLTQEIFIKVYRNLHTFHHQSETYTWIHRIAVNHVYTYLNNKKRFGWMSRLSEETVPPHREMTPQSTPADKTMEQYERTTIVWNAVQSLKPKYRIPLILHHYESISYKDIATIMELSVSAVEARIHRAKQQLIKKLEPMLEHI